MTSLLSRLAVGGVLIAALGGAVAPTAVAAPAPAVDCAEGNVLKDVFHSADHDGISVVFNYHCAVEGKDAKGKKFNHLRDVSFLGANEKPYPSAGEGKIDYDKSAKAWIRVVTDGYNWIGDTYKGKRKIAGEGAVKQIVHADNFEGQALWFIGLDKKRQITFSAKGKTVQVYVKVA
ncbi:hypothetical protein GCM10022247_24190 [Allokutzneria multivorans]|uniref:Uncharacterized protein n=1 Tax=Allokutzneria multivorans TaxID=1142134 RepID=A0ABP7RV79_9PSEU